MIRLAETLTIKLQMATDIALTPSIGIRVPTMKTKAHPTSLWIYLISSVFACPAFGWQDLTKEEVCSMLGVPAANGLAMKQGDVLVRERYVFDSVSNGTRGFDRSGILAEEETFYRLMFDFDAEVFAIYRIFNRSIIDLGKPETEPEEDGSQVEDGPDKYQSLYGACYAGDRSDVFLRHFPGKIQKKPRTEFPEKLAELLFEMRFRDYRLPAFNLRGNPKSTAGIKEHFQRLETGDTLKSFRVLDSNRVELEFRLPQEMHFIPSPHGKISEAFHLLQIDRESMMPVTDATVFMVNKPDGRTIEAGTGGGDRKHPPTKFKWKLVNNIHVIQSITNRTLDTYPTPRSMEHEAYATRKQDFHWFSVNEELDEQFFDGSIVEDRKKVLELLDPVKSNAESLLPKKSSK